MTAARDRIKILIVSARWSTSPRRSHPTAVEVLGDALGLKPILTMREGEVVEYKAPPGMTGRCASSSGSSTKRAGPDTVRVGLAHAGAGHRVERLPIDRAPRGLMPGSTGCARSARWWVPTADRDVRPSHLPRRMTRSFGAPRRPRGFPRPSSAPTPHLDLRRPRGGRLPRRSPGCGRARSRRWATCWSTCRFGTRTFAPGACWPTCAGRGGHGGLHRRSGTAPADAAAQPGDRGGVDARRVRPRRRDLVQPALPGQEPEARDATLDSRRAATDDRRRDRRQEPRAGRRTTARRCTPRAGAGVPGVRAGVAAGWSSWWPTRSRTPGTRSTRCPTA